MNDLSNYTSLKAYSGINTIVLHIICRYVYHWQTQGGRGGQNGHVDPLTNMF